ncbi:hypothetical protein [Streptomyces sp. NPDC050704]|uniref:hypothetical protein n=1 Tax=Streptomyces sp. NPDC050704 TaxID=3157219 RepID=UPI003446DEE6
MTAFDPTVAARIAKSGIPMSADLVQDADRLTAELEAEIRERAVAGMVCPEAQANGRRDGMHAWSGGSFTHARCELCGFTRTRGERSEETVALLVELDRTRVELAAARQALRIRDTQLARLHNEMTGGPA